jgi:pyridoxal phosphate enzyme (YggS family)
MQNETDFYQEQIATNLALVRKGIAEAAQRAKREPTEITLVAVSKTKPVELVQIAYNLGVSDFGENRVQEALPKIAHFHPPELHWHLIGHLQSNKAGKVIEPFGLIQSVDSLHLAQALQRHAEEQNTQISILLQVNMAGEASKAGMSPAETPELARQIALLPALHIEGLMTVAPLANDPEEIRSVFRALRLLRDRLRAETAVNSNWAQLSMGMTNDYRVAIEEGATIVRVGRGIFGARPPL